MSTWLISQVSAVLWMRTQNMLLWWVLLRWANRRSLGSFARLASIARAFPLLMGRSELHRRFVFRWSALLEVLRWMGRWTLSDGQDMAVTMLDRMDTHGWLDELEKLGELLVWDTDVLRWGRLEWVSWVPQVCVVPRLCWLVVAVGIRVVAVVVVLWESCVLDVYRTVNG